MLTNGTVVARTDVNNGYAIVRIQPDGDVPHFTPGQHLTVGWFVEGVLIERPFSIASSPDEPQVELYVQDPPQGRVRLSPHGSGVLTLEGVPNDRDLLMVASGTGIAPFISMYRAFKGTQRWRSFTIIHGVRVQADLPYQDELKGITYIPVVSREHWAGKMGHVQAAIEVAQLDRERTHAFICGNGVMVAEVSQLFSGAGFTHIHTEKYA